MNQVIRECAELNEKYRFCEEVIMNQLEVTDTREGSDLIVTYSKNFSCFDRGE